VDLVEVAVVDRQEEDVDLLVEEEDVGVDVMEEGEGVMVDEEEVVEEDEVVGTLVLAKPFFFLS
jgi:hypothetical protein